MDLFNGLLRKDCGEVLSVDASETIVDGDITTSSSVIIKLVTDGHQPVGKPPDEEHNAGGHGAAGYCSEVARDKLKRGGL